MANTWNQSGTTWNTGRWGTTDAITTGWGADTWSDGGSWGQANDEIAILTGQTITASLGEVVASSEQGWGRDQWGKEPWGESFSPVVSVDGLSITSSVGSLSAFNEQGWGRDTWNFESWGFSGLTVEVTAPDAITSNLGANGWSNATYGENGWGMFTLNPADVVGLTGVSATASVPTQLDIPEQISGLGATSSIGQLSINNGADHVQGLASLVATSATGAIAPADVIGISGLGATISIGSITVASVELVDVTGVGATASVGSISPTEMAVGLSGVSATASTGAISPTEMTMGLTGVSATVSVGQVGGPIAWKKVTPTQGGSWSKRTATQGGSWSKRTPS